eukprot:TRINITY_DN26444_c1_g1_i2.p4 TRINITY_DN26444_c1_g1~~TRINITY_DN26444_c1_g1_i2.p4  ORF type:complete len:107 (-),score=6.70 TRINITY_DN26444_c1_g1_i2:130-450(-)
MFIIFVLNLTSAPKLPQNAFYLLVIFLLVWTQNNNRFYLVVIYVSVRTQNKNRYYLVVIFGQCGNRSSLELLILIFDNFGNSSSWQAGESNIIQQVGINQNPIKFD